MSGAPRGPTRQRSGVVRKRVITAAIALAVGIPVVLMMIEHRALWQGPVDAAWAKVPVPVQDLLVSMGQWGLVTALAALVGYLVYRVWRLVNWHPGATITVVAGGGYADALRKKLVPSYPRWLRQKVSGAYVVPQDRIRGQTVKRLRSLEANALTFAVKPGEEENASRMTHKVTGREYAPEIARASLTSDRVLQVVSLGGMTGTCVSLNLANRITKRPVLGTVVGDTPSALVQAMGDPELFAKGRAYAAEHAPPEAQDTKADQASASLDGEGRASEHAGGLPSAEAGEGVGASQGPAPLRSQREPDVGATFREVFE